MRPLVLFLLGVAPVVAQDPSRVTVERDAPRPIVAVAPPAPPIIFPVVGPPPVVNPVTVPIHEYRVMPSRELAGVPVRAEPLRRPFTLSDLFDLFDVERLRAQVGL